MHIENYWLLGQIGILLEMSGALYIAVGSFMTHSRIRKLFFGIFALEGLREVPKLAKTVQTQTRSDILGFLLLAIGLLLQFIGNFGLPQ